jgi:MFS family permease
VYSFSVFKIPLSQAIGITKFAPGDWKFTTLGSVFSVAIVFLGLSAAVFGTCVERGGPRRAMFASALCFSSGFMVGALGVSLHQFWLLLLDYGVLGGIGLGLGRISPSPPSSNGSPTAPGWRRDWRSWGSGVVR